MPTSISKLVHDSNSLSSHLLPKSRNRVAIRILTCKCCAPKAASTDRNVWRHVSRLAASIAASILICSSPAFCDSEVILDPSYPLLDVAKIVPAGPEEILVQELQGLEERSGWKVRLLTRNGAEQGPSGEDIKAAWKYDARTAIIIVDPTSPNILQFQAGNEVTQLLKRGFFIELQSRFGNIFYVRDEGEASAAVNAVKTISSCLEKGGCAVVPGLPDNQYQLTLITSAFGGFIFGYSTTIQNQEYVSLQYLLKEHIFVRQKHFNLQQLRFVQRRFVWPLLFAPLWGTLFVSFGIGPIVTRVDDKLPLIQNFAAFLVAAFFVRQSPLFKASAVDLSLISKEGQKEQDAKDMRED